MLAAVPEDVEMLNISWPTYEVKYAFFERLIQKRTIQERRDADAWRVAFAQVTVFIYDPRPASKVILASEQLEALNRIDPDKSRQLGLAWLAEESAKLMPSVWLSIMDLTSDNVLWEVGTVEAFWKAVDTTIALTKRKFQNVRRNVLQMQQLFERLLPERPCLSLFDRFLAPSTFTVDTSELILSIVPTTVLDEGHGPMDLPILDQARQSQRYRLTNYGKWRTLPPHIPGRISAQSSSAERRIQLADVAAGYARDIYSSGRLDELHTHFRKVYVNGREIGDARLILAA